MTTEMTYKLQCPPCISKDIQFQDKKILLAHNSDDLFHFYWGFFLQLLLLSHLIFDQIFQFVAGIMKSRIALKTLRKVLHVMYEMLHDRNQWHLFRETKESIFKIRNSHLQRI